MEVREYDAGMSVPLAAHVNGVLGGVPHCYSVEADVIDQSVRAGMQDAEGRYHGDASLVAVDGGAVRGLAVLTLARGRAAHEYDQGFIRFLSYERGDRRTGQSLLDAAERRVRERTKGSVFAFASRSRLPGYHFEHAYLSDRLDHVQALLAANGYRKCFGEVFLEQRDYIPETPTPVDSSYDIAVEWEPGKGTLPGLHVKATHSGTLAGECRHMSAGEYSSHSNAQKCAFCTWLGVAVPHQGSGLGAHLLRRSLAELKKTGYADAAISTDWENHRAFVFYANYGYRVSDWTYGYQAPDFR